MRDLLLGYLLGALEPHEQQLVEERLAKDTELQEELHRLAEDLLPLADADGEFEPPPGLAARTCEMVSDFSEDFPEAVPAEVAQDSRKSRPEPIAPRRSIWGWADISVTAGVVAAAAMLFFPSIASSWYESRKLACQENLTQIGRALVDYSIAHHQCFPALADESEVRVAGVYGPTLLESGMLSEARTLICPGSALARDEEWRAPSLQQLQQATGAHLAALQKASGGSYGYTLGHLSNGRYLPTRNQSRPYFAIMSDTPSSRLANHQSENHCGRGQNVLYEDQHIRFLEGSQAEALGDDLFANRNGIIAAGADENDSVIGASDATPLLQNVFLPRTTP